MNEATGSLEKTKAQDVPGNFVDYHRQIVEPLTEKISSLDPEQSKAYVDQQVTALKERISVQQEYIDRLSARLAVLEAKNQ